MPSLGVMPAPDAAVHVRRATRADMPALGRLGALLMRTHYGFDPRCASSIRVGNPESRIRGGFSPRSFATTTW